ncbi:MAG: hypothetical protein UT14_C0020G0007 [Candidatus Shapirobacteria bacterium GW2011_GWE1_38_92]|uniref:Uncharacterized protein n=1 Tax=Candidatus Shapirobacteria bacterium GW2011_GWE1_38_92 TaxID=1618489 RepID=A0A0G0LT79_9BACT|nr:MAG: hypothetical protein UT14_C0020G0007 [Candidatus Shapirobacteria bacterium GW2011_GWE1_38_92]
MASKYQENLKRFPGVPSAYWPKEEESSTIKPLTDEQIKKREEMLAFMQQLDDIKKRK